MNFIERKDAPAIRVLLDSFLVDHCKIKEYYKSTGRIFLSLYIPTFIGWKSYAKIYTYKIEAHGVEVSTHVSGKTRI
jgi:hypothetical protein